MYLPLQEEKFAVQIADEYPGAVMPVHAFVIDPRINGGVYRDAALVLFARTSRSRRVSGHHDTPLDCFLLTVNALFVEPAVSRKGDSAFLRVFYRTVGARVILCGRGRRGCERAVSFLRDWWAEPPLFAVLHGGTHHGCFRPAEGASDKALALFSFPQSRRVRALHMLFGVDP